MDHADIIERLGGYVAVAAIAGVHPSRAHHWKREGIPQARWPTLVIEAEKRGHPISIEQLFAGRPSQPQSEAP